MMVDGDRDDMMLENLQNIQQGMADVKQSLAEIREDVHEIRVRMTSIEEIWA